MNHPLAKPVQNVPCILRAAYSKLPLKLQGTDSRRVCRHKVRRPKPFLNRNVGAVQNRAGRGRRLSSALLTFKDLPPTVEPSLPAGALRAHKTVGPPALDQISSAGLGC